MEQLDCITQFIKYLVKKNMPLAFSFQHISGIQSCGAINSNRFTIGIGNFASNDTIMSSTIPDARRNFAI